MTVPALADNTTVLLVEDDDVLRQEMAGYLTAQGYAVREADTAAAARAVLDSRPVDVLVLDVNLPGESGLSLCRQISGTDGPAILLLSALGDPVDRIVGLELGADDYVVKPIPPRELLARVKALLRRRTGGGKSARSTVHVFAGFRLDVAARQLTAPNGVLLLLTPGEFTILSVLVENARSVVSRDELMSIIAGEAVETFGRRVDLHISRLRRKIEAQSDQELIRTYRGLGYMLDAKVSVE
ncbi:response regulator with CheY-like receiver domain and winged-helix DNA-binding domain [Caulobacter sp. AP07]|jgi:two-component system OmpR family response regulator|uniref:response regulator n=1 Tax=Caulobacter sp. AP07 TaxID=1144304 RepID=UPI00027215CA|nr:response regulator transcription factor [Caulobacter sp. AP07]EJL34813.1 response regulator with CheY-like receiver domain and winged-helix DNA-binding domain [Caulobacter sp. AP07]